MYIVLVQVSICMVVLILDDETYRFAFSIFLSLNGLAHSFLNDNRLALHQQPLPLALARQFQKTKSLRTTDLKMSHDLSCE